MLISIGTVILGIFVFAFAVIRWLIDQKRTRQLVSVHIASILEGIAGHCLSITYDNGTWSEEGGHNYGKGSNNTIVNSTIVPAFADIKNVEYIGRTHLNRLLALAPIDGSIQSYLYHVAEHDSGSFGDYFHDRQILYAGYGEYVSRLAKSIRLDVKAPGIGTLANETAERIKEQLSKLIVSSRRDKEDIKDTYERVFLPITESYWPDVVQAKPSKLEYVTKTDGAKSKTT